LTLESLDKNLLAQNFREQKIKIIAVKHGSKKPDVLDFGNYLSGKKSFNSKILSNQNYGVICGTVSDNLTVVDLEKIHPDDYWNKAKEPRHIPVEEDFINKILPDCKNQTFTTKTGSGCYHILVKGKEIPDKTKSFIFEQDHNNIYKIDLKVTGQCVEAGSIHENGKPYEMVSSVKTVKKMDLQFILMKLDKIGFKPLGKTDDMQDFHKWTIEELLKGNWIRGKRRTKQKSLYCKLRRKRKGIPEIKQTIIEINNKLEEPLEESELENNFQEAENFFQDIVLPKLGYAEIKEGDEPTYLGYAKLVLDQCKIKTLKDTKEILHQENGVYVSFGENKIKQILLEINPELRINAVNEIIEKNRQLTDTPREAFDNNEFETCFLNGFVNVKTSKYSVHDPKKLFRTQLPVTYDPKAICPKFMKFMHTVLPLPDDYIDQLEAFSTGLIQNTPKLEAMFFETGEGDNGKSTFFNIMNWFYGKENYSTVSIQDLIVDKFAKIRLEGKRINTFPDIESGSLVNLGILKAIVSGDTIDAQNKYERAHSFINCAKLFSSANELPELKEKTFANFKRIRLKEWTQTFCKPNVYDIHKRKLKEEFKDLTDLELEKELALNGFHKMDKQFINSILEDENEKSGILNLLLIVIRNIIKRDGFFKEYDLEELKNQWSKSSTAIESFNNECLIKEMNPENFVIKSEVHMVYYYCCKALGKPPKPDNVFHKQFKAINPGIEEEQKRIGKKRPRVYLNFKWNLDNEIVQKYRSRLTVTGYTGKNDNLPVYFESSENKEKKENKDKVLKKTRVPRDAKKEATNDT